MRNNIAVIFAGGSGARMGAGLAKQFLEVNGKPIIIHTLEIFDEHPEIDKIYVACKVEYITKLKRLVKRYLLDKIVAVVEGGATGQESIFNALKLAYEENPKDSVVLLHDGVRPCIPAELITANIESVGDKGNAVTCTSMFETPVVSRSGAIIEDMPDRNVLYTAQAPQSFILSDVYDAHILEQKKADPYAGVVDTASLMKKHGMELYIVAGPRGNIKVTTPEDLYIFRAMLEYKQTEHVFGFGAREVTPKLKK